MTILTRVMGDTKRSWDVGLFVFFSVCDCMCEVHIICLELLLSIVYSFSLILKKIVIYFMIALSLHWCMWAFSGYDEHGAVHAKSLTQSCSTLCNVMDCSLPGSSVHGILQAKTLEWTAMPSSRGSSQLRGQTCISHFSCIGMWVLYH